MDQDTPSKLEETFDASSNNKKYKVKAIINTIVYNQIAGSQLASFHYLAF